MKSFCSFLIPLLLSALVDANANSYEIEIGKAEGFTHGMPDLPGDYMTSTFCYCGSPVTGLLDADEGHYFLFEYYNKHINTTYILSDTCKSKASDSTTCFPPRREHDDPAVANGPSREYALYNFGADGLCRMWPRMRRVHGHSHDKRYDKLCYLPHASKKSGMDDYITFNGQKRNIADNGSQGQTEEVVGGEVCDGMCLEYTGLPMLRRNEMAESHVVRNKNMDDMCDHDCE